MISDDSSQFYARLPALGSFFQVSNPANYQPLPNDWYIGVTDIEDSTKAIENHQYKMVNILGVSPIIGLLNKADNQSLPFSFGGDGATICIPPNLLTDIRTVFAACQQIGRKEYNLKLRAAVIPLSFVKEHGFDVNVAKFRVSDFYNQAAFIGGGLSYAEDMLKQDEDSKFHISNPENVSNTDFSGLECRWNKVSPENKSVLSILIKCNPNLESPEALYNQVLQRMNDIFGFDEETNPITTSQLSMNMSISKLMGETKFRTFGQGLWGRIKYLLKIETQTLIGKILMFLNYKTSVTDWSRYKSDLAINTDHRKFDDMLRLVISGNDKQKKELQEFLENMFQRSSLAYGIHSSDSAMITCMVFAYHRQHIHFVDGSEGGYVEASKGLKKRLKKLNIQND